MFILCKDKIKIVSKIFLFFTAISVVTFANANDLKNVPELLQQWVPWVLKDTPSIECPVSYNQNRHYCATPNSLTIDIAGVTGEFQQAWDVYAESWIALPGDNKNWPKNVYVNNRLQPVISRNNIPVIHLDKGRYDIAGEFQWQQQPKSLSIPRETGLVNLTVDYKKINFADFRDGKLWLKTTSTETHQNNRLDLQVFRKITDSIPLRITTRIKLDVSGQQREIMLEGALLKGFMAGQINSSLPAQLDQQGRLKVQIRAGQWDIDVISFNQHQLDAIALPAFKKPWPSNEIWVLEQQPQLRLIKVVDKNSIDPNQTRLAQNWKTYPAFNMQGGEQLSFDVIKRGNPEPEPDQLTLKKRIWLDFDGDGFTINDKITGKLSRQWRLNAAQDVTMGLVTLNGKPQFITQTEDNKQGIEVRHGNLDLSADSRISNNTGTFSASGWDIDFNQLDATLYIPAGWELLSLSGATVNNSWINNWTLLDLFMVLITAIAIYKLWGLKWGVAALLTLILVWHEYFSPQFIWINLIIAIAVLRALPEGRLYKLVFSYRMITSIILIIIILPFIVNQARTALYPQLEFDNMAIENTQFMQDEMPVLSTRAVQPAPAKMKRRVSELAASIAQEPEMGLKSGKISDLSYFGSDQYNAKKLQSIDPDAMIQTGPGLPSWSLHQYTLDWDGPVSSDQTISMVLLSPAMHRVLNILRIALVLLLAWRLLDINSLKLPGLPSRKLTNDTTGGVATLFMAIVMGSLFSLSPVTAEAVYPPQPLLDELHEELIKPAECLPSCASIESMSIDLSPQQLDMNLRVHAQEDVLIPLPVPVKQWSPATIRVDGKKTTGLVRDNVSILWLHVEKGTHDVAVSGRVDYLNQLQLGLPLKPHHITVNVNGWSVEGMDQQTHKINALTFLRFVNENINPNINAIQQAELPVYAEVSRVLELGLDWQVTTHVKALSGSAYPVILSIPLLAGESVLTDNVKVEGNNVLITLTNNNRSAYWTSKLPNTQQIKLKATDQAANKTGQFIEKWMLEASPVWHVDIEGIPVIYHQRLGNRWRPEWQPWPGETISINVSRPKGIKGNTVTIDNSTLALTPGEQITAARLVFDLRSSLGGQHNIHLPADADLQTVVINDQSMPIRNTAEGIALPISPGKQTIEIEWHEARGISTIYKTSSIDLGSSSVNNMIKIHPGDDRWVLFTSGPTMGPAVLFWGMLGVILIIAYALGRVSGTPLTTLQWVLLGIGLSASEPWALIIIAGSILALRLRGMKNIATMSKLKFNLFQLALIALTFISVTTLVAAIEQGLLGSPDMQIIGNGSSVYQLNWFSDRISNMLPQSSIVSVPVYVYRLMMLAWSIWLAFALLSWAQWGWGNFTKDEYWRSISFKKAAKLNEKVTTQRS